VIDFGYGVTLGPLVSWRNEQYRTWRNHPRIWKNCRQHDPISDIDQTRWFERQSLDPTIKMYEIIREDMPIGVCGLTSIDSTNRRAEFSLYIEPGKQGNGFGELALKTLVSHGFKNLNLHVIWGETFDGNPAAELFKRAGFKKEGTRRQFYFRSGKYIDAHLYSVLSSEWTS
jgi:[ribosomal protein S5]-alanine N-acetyltransferase